GRVAMDGAYAAQRARRVAALAAGNVCRAECAAGERRPEEWTQPRRRASGAGESALDGFRLCAGGEAPAFGLDFDFRFRNGTLLRRVQCGELRFAQRFILR